MATHLNPSSFQLSDVYGGRERVKDLSGWEGDTTFNATDKKPSIGEDDYKSDLDSVNLIGRMQEGQSYDQAISSYYADLQKDSTLREREFLKNKDWKQVRSTIYASILPLEVMEKGEDAIKAYIESNYPGVSKFLNRLEAVADQEDDDEENIQFISFSLTSCIIFFYFFPKQPKNIFDEIYQETEKTYRSNNILRNIDGFKIRAVWPSDDPNILYTPFGLYNKEKTPSDYSEIEIGFNFQNSQKVLFIYSERRLSSNVSVKVWGSYNYKLGVLSKEVTIIKKENNSKVYIDEQSEVKSYLEQYGITTKDLGSYYDDIVNQRVLKDWCSIYDSKYSPSNYGDVKIETQWENW